MRKPLLACALALTMTFSTGAVTTYASSVKTASTQNLVQYKVGNISIIQAGKSKAVANPFMVKQSVEYMFGVMKANKVNTDKLFPNGLKIVLLDEENDVKRGNYDNRTNVLVLYASKEWTKEKIARTVIHEIGHAVEFNYLTDKFDSYRVIRGIPDDWNIFTGIWEQSPSEAFAEDFRQLFTPKEAWYTNRTDVGDMKPDTQKAVAQFIFNSLRNETK